MIPPAAAADADADDAAFQHYRILRREDGSLHELGRGAMGVTFKAFDTNLRCPVALKVVNGTFLHHPTARARFLREARAAAALRHRNVAIVHHLHGEGDHYFYAMEFIDGETVEAWVRRVGRLPVGTALGIVLQVARALGAAHKQNLVHRDVKPANLMVVYEDDDEQYLIKLIDFGLARAFRGPDESSSPAATRTPTIAGFVGTPAYSSPEQLEEMELDTRSDIYSLGVTLWFMLAGRTPFSGTLAQLCQQHAGRALPWEQLAGEPEPVRVLLQRLLQKDPADRPQNPAELRARVLECLRAIRAVAPRTPGPEGHLMLVGDEEWLAAGTDADPRTTLPRTAVPAEPVPGLELAQGLRLGPRVGEGSWGVVFQGLDPRREDGRVAVKVFHADVGGPTGGAGFARRRERAGKVRAVPHPNILEVVALEQHGPFHYLITEWVEGFTLVGLLGKRGGALTVAECLRLLRQVVAAAGHARAHGLTGLELAPHQILVHFPDGLRADDPEDQAIFRAPLTEWPEFALKLDAMGEGGPGGAGGLATWSGGVTQVPAAPDGSARPGEADLRALGILVYELLGGGGGTLPLVRLGAAVAVVGGEPRETRPPPLPVLGEEGNAVLQRALSAAPGFADEGEFYAALARATGFDPETVRPRRSSPSVAASAQPPRAGTVAATVPVTPPAGGTARSRLRRWSVSPVGAGLRRGLNRGRALVAAVPPVVRLGVGLVVVFLGSASLAAWGLARRGVGEPAAAAPAPMMAPPPPAAGTSGSVTRAILPPAPGPGAEFSWGIQVSSLPGPSGSPGPAAPPVDLPTPAPLRAEPPAAVAGLPLTAPAAGGVNGAIAGEPPRADPSAPSAPGPSARPSTVAAAAGGSPGPTAAPGQAAAVEPAAAEEDDEDDKKDRPAAKKDKDRGRKRTAPRSSSGRRRRSKPAEPNFFERLFNIRPRR